MSYLTWKIRYETDGRYSVVGTHNEFGVDPRYEVYQFQTLEWAALCKASVERLSNPYPNLIYTGSRSASGFTTIAFSEEYIATLLKELTLLRVASFWLTPAIESAKKGIKQFSTRLLWGENGSHK